MDIELTRGRFRRRYQRFFADVELDSGEVVVAHCPNTGTMATLLHEGLPCWIERRDGAHRKLAWTLTVLGLPGGARAMVETSLANRIVAEGIRAGLAPDLDGYAALAREVRHGRSRIDLRLDEPRRVGLDGPCWIEVKNATMMSATASRRCDFPDAVTERGRKHLGELTELAASGVRAVQFFLVSRDDCDRAGVAADVDPLYAEALRRAVAAGVELVAHGVEIGDGRLALGKRLPVELPP